MAVYTKIDSREILFLSKKFNLGKVIRFDGIKKGIENTNYLLKTKNKKYILTIFEKRVQKKDIPFFMRLMDNLQNKNIICPRPLKNNNGNYLTRIRNKTACIVTFLDGKDKSLFCDLTISLEVSKVNAAHEFLDSHNVWQDSTFLNFLEVLTVAIFPLNVIFSFGSKFMSAAKDGKATTIKLKANNLVNVFI